MIGNEINHQRKAGCVPLYAEEAGLFFNLSAGMHDENVIAKEKILFFIDTVFYIIKR